VFSLYDRDALPNDQVLSYSWQESSTNIIAQILMQAATIYHPRQQQYSLLGASCTQNLVFFYSSLTLFKQLSNEKQICD
jgi:hypothetical protein